MKDTRLWKKLEGFALDDADAAFCFSERLARENGWSAQYTARVVLEYRRFLYLSAVSGHAVTPSDDVDEAWHLHLCYTRSYWLDLCEGLLGFPLHHGPTKGGEAERTKYADWYGKTLERYAKEFGVNAPADIWPAPRERFTNKNFRKVDASSHFILRKSTVGIAAAGAVGAMLLAGCVSHYTASIPMEFLCFFGAIFVVFVLIAKAFGGGKKGGGGCGSGGCGGGGGCGSSGCGGGGCGGGGD